VYELMGLKTLVTQRSGDAGVDILVWHPSGMEDSPLKAVQVKRYAPSNRVGIAEVQRMKGVVIDFKAQAGEIVTTSWFTKHAAWSAAREPLTIELTDFDAFQGKIDEVINDRS
jgi:restriction endonuclease Mrr